MKKVLIVDPWGINNTGEYLNGLINGVSEFVDLTVFTNYYCQIQNAKADIRRVFFRKSEKMKKGMLRKIIRFFEYWKAYHSISDYLKRNCVEVVHINWLLFYSLDIRFLREIKKRTKKIVYTAHNVLPHIDGAKCYKELKTIYSLADTIILHGSNIQKEFMQYYPEFSGKTCVEEHGANLLGNTCYDEKAVNDNCLSKIKQFRLKFLFCGSIFFNKGADRLLKIWQDVPEDCLLIIAGKLIENYSDFDELKKAAELKKNILIIDEYVSDNTLNFLISSSDVIVLPYRHASMSGVVFTAADFKKTIISTNVGSIAEYLKDGEDSFVVENDDFLLKEKINYVCENLNPELLKKMGEKLFFNISKKCDWRLIGKRIVRDCY